MSQDFQHPKKPVRLCRFIVEESKGPQVVDNEAVDLEVGDEQRRLDFANISVRFIAG